MKEPQPTFCAPWREKHIATCPDDLQPAEQEAFDTHVVSCPLCMAVFADYSQLDALIRTALIPKRPLGLWKALLTEQDAINEVQPTELPDKTSLRSSNRLNKNSDNQ